MEKTFSLDDQHWFAELSGDANPIHVDMLMARRTQAGGPIVHGVHTLLWALDVVARENPDMPPLHSLRADFTAFLPVGHVAQVGEISGQRNRRFAVSSGNSVVMKVELRHAATMKTGPFVPVDISPMAPDLPQELRLEEAVGRLGRIDFAKPEENGRAAFPALSGWIGGRAVNGLLACTRLIGMVCPGLYSLFNRIDLDLVDDDGRDDSLAYRVTEIDDRFRRIKLTVEGGAVRGELIAAMRHPPTRQPSLIEVATHVDRDSYTGAVALVVGGSRGLGELAAKILASGGAEVLVTYANGRDDAESVVADILQWGGKARSLQYDVLQDIQGQIGAELDSITHVYYFATSAIFLPPSGLFNKKRFDTFFSIYVEAFLALCDALEKAASNRVAIYYPSTVAIAERPANLVEYAMAKAAGETLCQEINWRVAKIDILVSRLPRLPTDQTATFLSTQEVSALHTLIPLVTQLQSL